MRTLFYLLFLFLIIGCERKNSDEIFSPKIMELKSANYTNSFFWFDRLRDYEKDESTYPGYSTFRLKSRVTTDSVPVINLAISINKKYSSAEIRVEPNEKIENGQTFEILWRDKNGVRGLAEFVAGNQKGHLYFTSQIYDQIERECEFYLKTEDGYKPILVDDQSRNAFHITMIDYYGLISVY